LRFGRCYARYGPDVRDEGGEEGRTFLMDDP